MNTAESILVIITSSFLSIFLLLAIIATIFVIKVVRSVRRVVEKAEDVVDSAEAAAEAFKHTSGPMAALKLVRNIVELVNKEQKKRK
jgi:hypothetical protein